MSLVHYVEFLLPGFFFPEIITRKVEDRTFPIKSDIPAHCFAYVFFDREEVTTDEGEILCGKPKNRSGRIYTSGRVYDRKQLAVEKGEHSIIFRNVFGNGYVAAIHCDTGNWQPLTAEDMVLHDRRHDKEPAR